MSSLPKGSLVEICPYGEDYSFDYLGHLDGEQGVTQTYPRFDKNSQMLKVIVRLSGGLGDIEYPTKVLKVKEVKS